MKTKEMVWIAVCTCLIAVCSWISIPTVVPFTMQTFGIFMVLALLGGRRGTISIVIYILLGAFGIPVFSGGTGGPGILFGKTGGYILGFLATGLIFWGLEKLLGRNRKVQILGMTLGLAACYLFGTLWFMAVYAAGSQAAGFVSVLAMCVFPFIIPDAVKMALAVILAKRLSHAASLEWRNV